jgi:hypothetical protein
VAFLYSLDKKVAAHSSNLGIVSCFSGATFEVEHTSSQDVFFLWSVEQMYRQAPPSHKLKQVIVNFIPKQ